LAHCATVLAKHCVPQQPPRRWRFFIGDVLDAIERIQAFVKDSQFDRFREDDLLLAAVDRKFVVIGEAVRHVSSHIEDSYPSVPWREMADMRNLVARFYWGVNPQTLWDTVHHDLPPLVHLPEKVLEETLD
jgi:uncharacterized protein with HEPN domain